MVSVRIFDMKTVILRAFEIRHKTYTSLGMFETVSYLLEDEWGSLPLFSFKTRVHNKYKARRM